MELKISKILFVVDAKDKQEWENFRILIVKYPEQSNSK